MKTEYFMQSELQHCFDVIERQRIAIQSIVLALNDTQLHWTPINGGWSIQRIVEHLVLSDETIGRPQNAEAVETEAVMFRFLPRALRRAMVLFALKHDVALPLPTPVMEPHGNVLLSDLLSRWETGTRRNV